MFEQGDAGEPVRPNQTNSKQCDCNDHATARFEHGSRIFCVPVDINLSFLLPCFLLGVLFWYGLEGEVESRKRAYGGAREPFGGGQRGRG